MKGILRPEQTKWSAPARRIYQLMLVLVMGLAFLAFFSIQTSWADSGGWPTPTFTPLPLPTLTPTLALPPLLPTSTNTVMPLLTVTEAPALLAPTPIPERRNASLLCWPFAIAFILIVIVASIMLIQRRNYG